MYKLERTRRTITDAVREGLQHAFAEDGHSAELLKLASTHASYIDAQATKAERIAKTNERLEFLGDSLLDAAIAEMLYDNFDDVDEGTLSRYKSRLVSREMLARAIEQFDILAYCRIGEKMDDPMPDSVKANIAESLLAAVYKDAGWEALQKAVRALLGPFVEQAESLTATFDAKGKLQEYALQTFKVLPKYKSQRTGGTDHSPVFSCTVTLGEQEATAEGSSRRRSESAAAAAYLTLVE